jgi:two-component system, OmpR family, sensor kinase
MPRFSIPLSAQIVGLMLAGLVVAQAVTLFLTLLAPPAPSPEYSLKDVAAALEGDGVEARGARPLVRSIRSDPPSLASAGWLVSERSRRELAALLRTDEANVRLLFYSPLPFAGTGGAAGDRIAQAPSPLWLAHRPGWSGAVSETPAPGGLPDGLMEARYRSPRGPGGPRAGPPAGGSWRSGPGGSTSERFPGAQGPGPPEAGGPGPGIFPPSGPASGVDPTGRAPGPFIAGANPGGGVGGGDRGAGQAPGGPRGDAVGGPAGGSGPGLGGPSGGPAPSPGPGSGVGIPNVGSPETPNEPGQTSPVERHEAAETHAELSPRPAALAPAGPPVAEDVGVIVPAPLAAAQAGDASGWIVGTPQQTARGLFGLSPSPFVQGDFVAAVQLAPHRWATVAPKPEPFPNAWQRRVIWWFLAAFAVVGPLGYLFARRLALPIDRFAAAAERIGRDPAAPLAPLSGPAEIGRAAKAFNQMHSRLKRFVEDRTGMVGAISHDLRTPLARMRFRLERVPPDVREDMLTDIRQMEEMITSVLAFIRDAAEPSVRERVDLRSLVECVVDDAAMLGGEAVLDPGEPISVEVDTLGVQRVLTNLIDNALKYGDRADVRLYRDGAEAVAEVVDDGPGLPPEEIERVFLPFYRADQARGMNKGGIGLGLAVSRSIARAHGGDVLLAQNNHGPDGRGLKAQLRLPIASQAA